MKRTRKNAWMMGFLAVIITIAIVGCASKQAREPAPPQMPEWCMKTSGITTDAERGRLIIGVGVISGIKSPAMARVNADGQARTEIAKIFSSYTENLLKQYQRHTSADGKATEEQDFMQATRIFTKMNVRGAAIEDRYYDEAANTWYAKAVIPFDQLNDLIESNQELSDRVRDFVRQNAAKAFDELQEMSDKTPEG